MHTSGWPPPSTAILSQFAGRIAQKWYEVGHALGVNTEVANLKQTEQNPERKCLLCLEAWIERGHDCSWKKLFRVLYSLQLYSVTKDIQDYLCKSVASNHSVWLYTYNIQGQDIAGIHVMHYTHYIMHYTLWLREWCLWAMSTISSVWYQYALLVSFRCILTESVPPAVSYESEPSAVPQRNLQRYGPCMGIPVQTSCLIKWTVCTHDVYLREKLTFVLQGSL